MRTTHFRRITTLLACGVLAVGAYVVKEGDTLWDLSREFRNDPFAWVDLWKRNTHIPDPHRIYPGDSLDLGTASSTDTVVLNVSPSSDIEPADTASQPTHPKGVRPSSAERDRNTEFQRKLGVLPNRTDPSLAPPVSQETQYTYNKPNPPTVFNRYYQWLAPQLMRADSMRADSSFIRVRHGEKMPGLVLQSGNELRISLGKKKSSLAPGATIELWLVEPVRFRVHPDSAFREYALTRLAGFAKVEFVGDTLSLVRISQLLLKVSLDQVKARLHVVRKPIQVRSYQTVQAGEWSKMPRIHFAVDPSLEIGAYSYVLIDGGQQANLHPGDGVAFLENQILDPSLSPRLLGRGIVVSSSPHEAVVLVRELKNAGRLLQRGTRVALTHKAIPLGK